MTTPLKIARVGIVVFFGIILVANYPGSLHKKPTSLEIYEFFLARGFDLGTNLDKNLTNPITLYQLRDGEVWERTSPTDWKRILP